MACIRSTTVFCVLFLALYAVFSQVEANECYSDSGCGYLKYCCERKYPSYDNICLNNCIGESCTIDDDCAPSETCCGVDKKCGTTCIGKSCTYRDSHCATGETCCGNSDKKCATTCIGKSCDYSYHCATGECCNSDDKCDTDCSVVIKGLAGWIVAVIVISVIVVIVIPIAVVVFCCFCAAGAAAASRRPAHGGIVLTQPTTTGNTVFATQQQQQQFAAQQGQPMYFQNSQPYPNQPPPEYQPQGTVYPRGASGGYIAMTPQTQVKP
ncbi:Hypothetical predicted protein [Paramuricea clavata]|uniref:Uncharacterized protein n=1 Tax=Paramuricea clavata TaxID=317549 RepID=A0A6S7JKN4_PARCT|nr:Hypothetical predicted protein [Paramuricea clavata]